MEELKQRMQKTIENLKSQLSTVRTGRANPDILAKISVDYYGTRTPLQQVASVSVPEPMMLLINIFDRNAVKNVERAILTSDLGLNPQTDGSVIRLRLPELTEERRKELVKQIKKQSEEGRVAIRNIRRDYMEGINRQEKNKEISEDENTRLHDDAQKITDDYISKIEEIAKKKEAEIIQI
ncbi:ribosome recycling factor [Thermoproteota archaeon]